MIYLNVSHVLKRLFSDELKISRYYNISNDLKPSHIAVSLLDYNIKAYYNKKPTEHKESDRAFLNFCFDYEFDKEEEREIIDKFNKILKRLRKRTYSLIFTAYREYDRKRLTFSEAEIILRHVIYLLFDVKRNV